MEVQELKTMAQRLLTPLDQIARWHLIHGPKFVSKNPGRPKGKLKRPLGTISLGDARAKYRLKTATLQQWREEGLQFTKIGTLIAVDEKELKHWIKQRRPSEML